MQRNRAYSIEWRQHFVQGEGSIIIVKTGLGWSTKNDLRRFRLNGLDLLAS